ncbi:hypothetical protein GYMLUDRAFT_37323 [Collybiopsis luxurians FD-317 M1]|nr:hypothetical protein GYMLUDRAFT_37323 [Collybiopsis luxurians FD-317 M1]
MPLQNNSSTPSRTPQIPRTPASKTRLDKIRNALADNSSDSRVNNNNQLSTPTSNKRAQTFQDSEKQKRDEAIRPASGDSSSQTKQRSSDASVFQSSQPPPSYYQLQGPLFRNENNSDQESTPMTEFRKRTRVSDSDEGSESDSQTTPSKSKGKKKANVAHDLMTPGASVGDVTGPVSSQKLTNVIGELNDFSKYVIKLERQVKALTKSNEAKMQKIQQLEDLNAALKAENDELRKKL